MKQKIFLIILFVVIAGSTAFLTVKNYVVPKIEGENVTLVNIIAPKREVIGFLPYWLASKADSDYSKYITNLTYFSLSVNEDGSIQEYTNPGESEPGFYSLTSGKMDGFLNKAKQKNLDLSVSVFSGDNKIIAKMVENPKESAQNFLKDITPIMKEYDFTELNLDIEYVGDTTPEMRKKYTQFVKEVRKNLDNQTIRHLSIDVSASAFVKETNLVDPDEIAPFVDKIIIMAYDYHYRGSYVTGPVAPGEGAGIVSEFDTQAAVEAALKVAPAGKIILGAPLYGYEWESIGDNPRSAVVPGSGLTISNSRAEEFLAECATCSAVFDETDKETHVIYKDQQTGTYHQVFYPNKQATEYKIELAKKYSLKGMAFWALGYEGKTILEPLASYHN